MKLSKIFISLLLIFAFVFTGFSQKFTNKKIKVTNKDKSEILKKVFDDGFDKLITDEKFSLCTIPIVKDKKIILIETDEPKMFLKGIGEYQFIFMKKKEIEAEIKSNNGDCFFQINSLQFNNSKEANICLWRWINVITVINGESFYPSRWVYASGRIYKATKEKGKWQVKYLHGTAVVS